MGSINTIIVPSEELASYIYDGNYKLSVRYISDPDKSFLTKSVINLSKKLPETTDVCIVLKSKLCDHNIVPYASALKDVTNRVNYFAVQSIEEAIRLRLCGVNQGIMLLANHNPDYFQLLSQYNIEPSIIFNTIDMYTNKASNLNFHLWVDTGMGRDGYTHNELKKVDLYKYLPNIIGIGTHLNGIPYKKRNGRIDKLVPKFMEEYTKLQKDRFERTLRHLEENKIKPKYVHASASPALQNDLNNYYYNLVRPGRLLTDCPTVSNQARVLVLTSKVYQIKVLRIKEVEKNWYLGYTRFPPLARKKRIGILSASEVRYLGRNTKVTFRKNRRIFKLPILLSHGSITVVDLDNVPVDEGDYVDLNYPDGFDFEIYVPVDKKFNGVLYDPLRNQEIIIKRISYNSELIKASVKLFTKRQSDRIKFNVGKLFN